jgi:glycine cleavage system H protein
MPNLKFTTDHEWIRVEGDTAVIGVTDYAQQQLGDVVFVELPAVGAKFAKGAAAAVVESVKAASDIYSPVGGEVVAINDAVQATTSLINEDAQGRGWLFQLKLSDPGEVDGLMDDAAYAEFLKTIA